MKIGFIGCGNMGSAMLSGMIDSGRVKPQDIMVTDKLLASRVNTQKKYGVEIASTNVELTMIADIIILAVKPQFYEEVLLEIKDALWADKILVSIAPGKSSSEPSNQNFLPLAISRNRSYCIRSPAAFSK